MSALEHPGLVFRSLDPFDGDANGEPLADMRADIVAQALDLVAAAATS